MKSSFKEMCLLKLLILLIFCCNCSANIRSCSTNLLAIHKFSPYVVNIDVANYVLEDYSLSCDDARQLCYENMILHLNDVLGDGFAYIQGSAATDLCNMIQLEIPPTNPSHVYAYWIVNNCGNSGYMNLGQICCWKYDDGDAEVFVNNPECTQSEKPGSEAVGLGEVQKVQTVNEEQKPGSEAVGLGEVQKIQTVNEEQKPGSEAVGLREVWKAQTVDEEQKPGSEAVGLREVWKAQTVDEEQKPGSEAVGLGEAQIDQAVNEEEVHFKETPTNEKRFPLRSGKLRGLNHLDLNGMDEEEEGKPLVQVVREKILNDLQE